MWCCESLSSVWCGFSNAVFFPCIVLVLLIRSSSHIDLSFYIFCFLPFLLGKRVISTNLVHRIVCIGYLLAFTFGVPVFLFSPHRICPSISFVLLFLYVFNFFPVEFFESFNRSYIVSCIKTVIVSMFMSLFRNFYFKLKSPVDLPISDRNFDAINSAGVIFWNWQFFSTCSTPCPSSAVFLSLFQKNLLYCEICFVPV